jgi:hypothetical protein
VAKRRFDHAAGERWTQYLAWSGLSQLAELVSLDEILCPTVPSQLVPEDWKYNVHADYHTSYFRSFQYLRERVAFERNLNLLGVLRNPTPQSLGAVSLPDFTLLGFDVVDVHGDISALANCSGFDDVFAGTELSSAGLLPDLGRADEVRHALLRSHPQEQHAECHVWAIWRHEGSVGAPT